MPMDGGKQGVVFLLVECNVDQIADSILHKIRDTGFLRTRL